MRMRVRVRAGGSNLVVFGTSDSPAVLVLRLCQGRIVGGWRSGCFVSCTIPEESDF